MNKAFKIVLLNVCLFVFTSTQTNAQQNHFVYIQTDEKISFDVSVNGKTYNSSSIGYVIIPKLAKGTYQLNVSFANKKYPDQQFNCIIDKLDAGFLLKNYTDKGWGLFNLQSFDITMATKENAVEAEQPKTQPDNNAFGNMLSQVANDTTLFVKTEIVKPVVQKPLPVADSAVSVKNESAPTKEANINASTTEEEKKEIAISEPKTNLPHAINPLLKLKQLSSKDGTDVVFIDSSSGMNDTIRIFLPAQPGEISDTAETEQQSVVLNTKTGNVVEKTAIDSSVMDHQADTITEKNGEIKNPFFAKEEQKQAKTVTNVDSNSIKSNEDRNVPVANAQPAANVSDCKNMLSESDMDKLRKKMVSANTDDKMIGVAKKNIQDKCISTSQVKSLGALFLSDDGRLNFFSAVYGSVYDKTAFSALENQLIDPNYKKRFKDFIK